MLLFSWADPQQQNNSCALPNSTFQISVSRCWCGIVITVILPEKIEGRDDCLRMAATHQTWNHIFIDPNTHFYLERIIGKIPWVLMSYLLFFFFKERLTYGGEHTLALKISIYFKTSTVAIKDTVSTVYPQFSGDNEPVHPRVPIFSPPWPVLSWLVQAQLSNHLADFCYHLSCLSSCF